METFNYPHFSQNHSIAHIALFTSVTNAGELRKRIISAASLVGEEGNREREAVNFAFIDARLITSKLHLQTAIHQALLAESQDSLRTKTVHSEIIWILNPTNNITEALRRYGVSDSSTALIVVRIDGPRVSDSEVKERMAAVVEGELQPLDKLQESTDWSAVKKHYKLNQDLALLDAKGGSDTEKRIINEIVVSSVAIKSVAS